MPSCPFESFLRAPLCIMKQFRTQQLAAAAAAAAREEAEEEEEEG